MDGSATVFGKLEKSGNWKSPGKTATLVIVIEGTWENVAMSR